MNSIFARILGIALIISAIAAILFSGWGVVQIWRIKEPFTNDLISNVVLTRSALEATSQGLFVAEAALTQAMVDVVSVQHTLEATGRALRSSRPTFDSISTLLENDLPDAITATTTALDTAQSSARVIENFLRTISRIPFLPIDDYDPPVPLHESLGEVSESLAGVPATLIEMEENISSSQGNIIVMEAEFNIMARHVAQINESLRSANTVVSDYQEVITELQVRTDNLETQIRRWSNNLAWFLTIALVWLAITQAGFFVYGVQLLAGPPKVERVEELVVEKQIVREEQSEAPEEEQEE